MSGSVGGSRAGDLRLLSLKIISPGFDLFSILDKPKCQKALFTPKHVEKKRSAYVSRAAFSRRPEYEIKQHGRSPIENSNPLLHCCCYLAAVIRRVTMMTVMTTDRDVLKCFAGQITVEKSARYIILDQLVSRIYQMNSSIRLLVTFRDPVERAISGYLQVPPQVV